MTKPFFYFVFAVLATIINISTQEISSNISQNKYEIFISMLTRTAAGLIVKYYLDKKYVFIEGTK